MQGSKILVSSGAFDYCFCTLPRRLELIKFLSATNRQVFDGLEWLTNFEQLERWVTLLKSGEPALPGSWDSFPRRLKLQLLGLSSSTVHLDDLTNLPEGGAAWLAAQLFELERLTGISDFTVHPDRFDPELWGAVLAQLPPKVVLSVENMDPRRTHFRALSEIAALLKIFPTLQATVDICHWVENGYDPLAEEIRDFFDEFGSRVSKIHLSLPRSVHPAYGPESGIVTDHYLSSLSNNGPDPGFFKLVPDSCKWVIEGVIPAELTLLDREISVLRSALGVVEPVRSQRLNCAK